MQTQSIKRALISVSDKTGIVEFATQLAAKGVDIGPVQDRGPQEPVIVIPISVIVQRYPGNTPEESMKQFVEDMTANAAPPATEQPVSAPPEMAAAAAPPPSPEGLGAPMDRPPMTA